MFTSSDIYLTAALASAGNRYIKVTKTGDRITFSWDNPDTKKQADLYYAKSLPVDARTFADEIRTIKTTVHNEL